MMLFASTAHAEDTPMKSSALVATGIGTATIGSATVAGGIAIIVLYANEITFTASDCPVCRSSSNVPRNSEYLVGGTFIVVGGALAIVGSIPLLYFGAKHQSNVWITAGGFGGRF